MIKPQVLVLQCRECKGYYVPQPNDLLVACPPCAVNLKCSDERMFNEIATQLVLKEIPEIEW